MPTAGRLIAFTADYTPPAAVEPPPVPVVGADGKVDPPKIAPALPAGQEIVMGSNGVVELPVLIPAIDVATTRVILAGHAVVTPYRHPDLQDPDALMDPAKRYPTTSYGLSGITDGRNGQPLIYAISDVPAGSFSIGFVQDNAVDSGPPPASDANLTAATDPAAPPPPPSA